MNLLLAGSSHPIDLVVFDCDGVLLDTIPAKIEAFRRWVPEAYRQHEAAFVDFVSRSFGRSRSVHIEHFYRDLAGREVDDAFLAAEVDRFTALCEPLCAAAGWRPGSLEFVHACREAKALRCVLSGTPQAPLEAMLAAAPGYQDHLFHEIIGFPPAKPEALERLLDRTGTPAHRTVFIGDAAADLLAARHAGAHFVYFPSQAQRPAEPVDTEVADLRELLRA
jgi:phosphoglycolate phosphatase-like HAD superfamily hydrolase